MFAEPLPKTLDVRKAAARGVGVEGFLTPSQMARFASLLADEKGEIRVRADFSKDDEGRFVVTIHTEAEVQVTCQRCLSPMPEYVESDSTLGIVWSDEQAAALPRTLDPLIVEDQACDLHEVVEDELILALKPFNYHETDECKRVVEAYSDSGTEPEPEKPNPFNVLAQLKPGQDQ